MEIAEIMNLDVRTCSPEDDLGCAARIMWEGDCGAVPVVDETMKVVGIVTDRDACMAAYTKGLPLGQILVRDAMNADVATASPHDAVVNAERLMQSRRVRRIPITNDGQLVGMLSLADIARRTRSGGGSGDDLSTDQVALTLGAISSPRSGQGLLAPAS